ncbi:MAG: hypothetical protein MN733_04515 [Nitrososphaera sp.]|nr:hypothetical protein [Nitrososphaera sp.]
MTAIGVDSHGCATPRKTPAITRVDPNAFEDSFRICHSETRQLLNLPFGFDNSLDPCQKGWAWAINNPDAVPFPSNNGVPIIVSTSSILELENFIRFGCDVEETIVGTWKFTVLKRPPPLD